MKPSKFKRLRLALGLLIAMLAFASLANVQPTKASSPVTGMLCTTNANPNPTFTLTAQSGYIQMPDMNTVYMWSYGSPDFQHPGPVLCVNQGDTVTVVLNNQLPYNLRTSIAFPGQENVQADGAPAQPDLANNSLTNSAANGGSVTYSFVANKPGTFIYESGTDPKNQVTMGLFGALIVRPSMGAAYVYNRADSRFTPSEEFIALLSEVDPYQHQAWEIGSGATFNMNNYRARYWLINGRGFPDSIADNNASWLPSQPYGALALIHPFNTNSGAGANYHPYPALERFINVGTEEYPFHPHGQNGLVIGRDGNPLEGPSGEDLSMEKFAVNIGPGQTWDVIFKWYDAEGYNPATKPVPSTSPDLVNVMLGMFYSGSPYLGQTATLPPGANTLNQCGEYYIISHNHALFQLDAFGQVMSGPITYLRVDPPTPNTCS
ncbi:MAG TPA: multicopper oxidase domain-containing protein [Roseiflexaceae bacterium]|nr:multicopper oxidase domain-containing protein [Roseiflexaceae bacterium]